jgi:dihydroorotate dehydrogenase electron transfer subunit
VSMERMMACGIGLCQSCAVEVKANGEDETAYELCCKDGPVFDSGKVVFKC